MGPSQSQSVPALGINCVWGDIFGMQVVVQGNVIGVQIIECERSIVSGLEKSGREGANSESQGQACAGDQYPLVYFRPSNSVLHRQILLRC